MEFAERSSNLACALSPVHAAPATGAGPHTATLKEKLSSLERVDFYLLLLRLLTIAGGLLYYIFTAHEYSAYQVFAWVFPLYILYGVLLYAGILCWPHAVRSFYLMALVMDMLFIFGLIFFVGLFVGSFFIGFYLLVAIHSFYFGLRVGVLAALVTSLLYSYLYIVLNGRSLIPWPDFLVRNGFLFMISLSLGLISENERRQRRMLAEALDKASLSSRLKDQFLANVSHEFRTPLTYVMGYAEILLNGSCNELPPAHKTLVEKIFKSGQELLSLFDQFLKFSRLKAGDAYVGSEPVELRALLWEVMEELRSRVRNGHVNLKLDYPSHPVVVRLDRTLVSQVVSNLVANALKFTEKGVVQVSLRNGHAADAVRIIVEDTGMGIGTDEFQALFEEVRQDSDAPDGSEGGVGLGLAIVENALGRLGGEIHVDSIYGSGPRFTVTLPRELHQ